MRSATTSPTYSDGLYEICEFDHVEFTDPQDGLRGEGQITHIYPRKREACVRYELGDHLRARGSRRMRTVRVPFDALELIRRDG